MKTILVTGVGGPAGQNVTRLLLEQGYAVVGTDMRDAPVAGITFRRVRAANDPSFLDELCRLAAQANVELVIPTVTEELSIVAESWSKRSEIPAMIGPHQAVFTANDKYLTADWLANWNVSVPRYCLPSQVKSPDKVSQTIGWPCLSKPRVGRGGRGVTVWEEKDWPSVAALDDRFILQEFMSGADYAPNVLIGRDGKAVVIVIEKTKLKEGIVGNAAEVQRAAAPDVAELAVAAAKAMSFVGPLDIDVRRHADGKPAVLEINARFGANIANASEILEAALADWGVAR